jgi:hypothetical protein
MDATRASETSVYNKPTQRHIPEGGILHSYRRENLKSYITLNCFKCLIKYYPIFLINLKRLIFPLHQIPM